MEFIKDINKTWFEILGKFYGSKRHRDLKSTLELLYRTDYCIPNVENILETLKSDPDNIKVLFITSTHNTNRLYASGIPYSTKLYEIYPSTMLNFYKELIDNHPDDFDPEDLTSFNLSNWIKQGVFFYSINLTSKEFARDPHNIWDSFNASLFHNFFKYYKNKKLLVITLGKDAYATISKYKNPNHTHLYLKRYNIGANPLQTGVFIEIYNYLLKTYNMKMNFNT